MCFWCGVVWDVKGGGGLPVRRHSCRGHRVELWRIADWLQNDKKKLKAKQIRHLGCVPGLYPVKTGTIRFIRPMTGLVGCVFYLTLVLPVFGPKRTRYTRYLVSAAALKKTFVYKNFCFLPDFSITCFVPKRTRYNCFWPLP